MGWNNSRTQNHSRAELLSVFVSDEESKERRKRRRKVSEKCRARVAGCIPMRGGKSTLLLRSIFLSCASFRGDGVRTVGGEERSGPSSVKEKVEES